MAGAAHCRLSALAAWAIGGPAGWAALPTYLLFAWLTVGLIWIDLDVHRLPVGLVVPTGAAARRPARRRDRGDRRASAGGRAHRGGSSWGGIYLLLGLLPGGGVGGGDVRLAPVIGALLGWLSLAHSRRRADGRLPHRGPGAVALLVLGRAGP